MVDFAGQSGDVIVPFGIEAITLGSVEKDCEQITDKAVTAVNIEDEFAFRFKQKPCVWFVIKNVHVGT